MATWTYSAWRREATTAARLLMLRQHIEEVAAKIDADVAADGKSRSSGSLNDYLRRLEASEEKLAAAAATAGGVRYARFKKAGPAR